MIYVAVRMSGLHACRSVLDDRRFQSLGKRVTVVLRAQLSFSTRNRPIAEELGCSFYAKTIDIVRIFMYMAKKLDYREKER